MPDSTRPELFTSPETGQQRMVEMRYGGGDSVDPAALAQLFQNRKIKEAEQAMSAAIQFQGLRGYQQALESGKPAAEALTKYGPMMFYSRPQSFGPAVRAVTPPSLTPYQEATIKHRESQSQRPLIRTVPGVGLVSVNPTNQAVTTIQPSSSKPRTFPTVVDPGIPGLTPQSRVPMTGEEFNSFMLNAPPQARTNAVNTAIQRMIQPTEDSTGTNDVSEVIRTTKDNRRAVFDANTKKFLRYAK